MGVKLSGSLPDADRSGLDLLHGELVRMPQTRHLVVAVIDCARTTVDHGQDGEKYTPTAGVLYIEPILDPDGREVVEEVLDRARATRMGDGQLEFDFGLSATEVDADG